MNLKAIRIAITIVILFYFNMVIHEIGHYIAIIFTNNTFVRFKFNLFTFYTYWKKNNIISIENLRFIYINGVLFAIIVASIVAFISYLIKNYEIFITSFISIFYNLSYFMFSYGDEDGSKFISTFEHFNYELFYFIIILLFIVMWIIYVIGFYKIMQRREKKISKNQTKI